MSTAQLERKATQQDVELQQQIKSYLGLLGYRTLAATEVTADNGHVVLRGHVPTYYQTQLAQNTALGTPGCRSVENLIEVVADWAPRTPAW